MDFNLYADLEETGYADRTPKDPKNEMFHSCYIGGQTRTNESGIQEIAGKLQIRGVSFNHDNIYMIITHVKDVLVKEGKNERGWNTLECFSYKNGPPPWNGIAHGPCGRNSAERAMDPFCASCKSQIIIAGILTDVNGKPSVDDNKKPIFIFLRGKGTKYGNVSDYLGELSRMDLSPVFTPVTDKSSKFEKAVVNKMRFVTKIGIGNTTTKFGVKQVFSLETGKELSIEVTTKLLKAANDTLSEFSDKFDWSKNKGSAQSTTPNSQTSQPSTSSHVPSSFQNFNKEPDPPAQQEEFASFDDINFNF